jgi:hypothetical protein
MGDNCDSEYSYPVHSTGSATTLPMEPECEAVRELHQAIKDVTGKDVDPPLRRRIGFLTD